MLASSPPIRWLASGCPWLPVGLTTPSASGKLRLGCDGRSVVASIRPRAGILRTAPWRSRRSTRRHLDDLGRLTVEGAMAEHRGHLLERDTKTHRGPGGPGALQRPRRGPQSPRRPCRGRPAGTPLHNALGDSSAHLQVAPQGVAARGRRDRTAEVGDALCLATHCSEPYGATRCPRLGCRCSARSRPGDLPPHVCAPISRRPARRRRRDGPRADRDARAVHNRPVATDRACRRAGKRGEESKGRGSARETATLTRNFGGGDGT
jgi:hypothetical protein